MHACTQLATSKHGCRAPWCARAGVEEALEVRIASVGTRVGSSLSQELDKRFLGLYDHVDLQARSVRARVPRLGGGGTGELHRWGSGGAGL